MEDLENYLLKEKDIYYSHLTYINFKNRDKALSKKDFISNKKNLFLILKERVKISH